MRRLRQRLLLLVMSFFLGCLSLQAAEFAPIDRESWQIPEAQTKYTPAMVNLGKKFFFDPRLSGSRGLSCASCHHPGFAWSYPDYFMAGRVRQLLSRQVPSLLNIRFYRHFFWDARVDESLTSAIVQHLETLAPEMEFHSDAFEWTYRSLLQQAFGESDTSRVTVARALAAFLYSLTLPKSAFDDWVDGDDEAISVEAKKGFLLFTGKAGCVQCHSPPGFTDSAIHNIGLDSMDPGYFEISRKAEHRNSFRTPSLRQLSRTPPYMHNGIYASLQDVIQHYRRGGQLRGGGNELVPLHLTQQEQQQMLSFLQTLDSPAIDISIPLLPIGVR